MQPVHEVLLLQNTGGGFVTSALALSTPYRHTPVRQTADDDRADCLTDLGAEAKSDSNVLFIRLKGRREDGRAEGA